MKLAAEGVPRTEVKQELRLLALTRVKGKHGIPSIMLKVQSPTQRSTETRYSLDGEQCCFEIGALRMFAADDSDQYGKEAVSRCHRGVYILEVFPHRL